MRQRLLACGEPAELDHRDPGRHARHRKRARDVQRRACRKRADLVRTHEGGVRIRTALASREVAAAGDAIPHLHAGDPGPDRVDDAGEIHTDHDGGRRAEQPGRQPQGTALPHFPVDGVHADGLHRDAQLGLRAARGSEARSGRAAPPCSRISAPSASRKRPPGVSRRCARRGRARGAPARGAGARSCPPCTVTRPGFAPLGFFTFLIGTTWTSARVAFFALREVHRQLAGVEHRLGGRVLAAPGAQDRRGCRARRRGGRRGRCPGRGASTGGRCPRRCGPPRSRGRRALR